MHAVAEALVITFSNLLGIAEQELRQTLRNTLGPFRNPTPATPVRAAELLQHADLAFLLPLLNLAYKDPTRVIYPPLAMLRAMVYKHLKHIRGWDGLARTLQAYPEDAFALGFLVIDGQAQVPDGEWFRQWVHRVGNLRWQGTMDRLVVELRITLAPLGITLGERVTHDATAVPARGSDHEALYNDYYRFRGYKADLVLDQPTGLPLVKNTLHLTDAEGENLIPAWERARALGLPLKAARIDGGYTSFKNLAHAAVHWMEVYCKITETWVDHPEASLTALQAKYASYWQHPDYVARPGLRKLVTFLVERGEDELVGQWFRNSILHEYEEAPCEYLDVYHERNTSESGNAHLKNNLDLAWGWRGKGRRSFDLHSSLVCVSLLIVALTRAQHGVTVNLASLQGVV